MDLKRIVVGFDVIFGKRKFTEDEDKIIVAAITGGPKFPGWKRACGDTMTSLIVVLMWTLLFTGIYMFDVYSQNVYLLWVLFSMGAGIAAFRKRLTGAWLSAQRGKWLLLALFAIALCATCAEKAPQ